MTITLQNSSPQGFPTYPVITAPVSNDISKVTLVPLDQIVIL